MAQDFFLRGSLNPFRRSDKRESYGRVFLVLIALQGFNVAAERREAFQGMQEFLPLGLCQGPRLVVVVRVVVFAAYSFKALVPRYFFLAQAFSVGYTQMFLANAVFISPGSRVNAVGGHQLLAAAYFCRFVIAEVEKGVFAE